MPLRPFSRQSTLLWTLLLGTSILGRAVVDPARLVLRPIVRGEWPK